MSLPSKSEGTASPEDEESTYRLSKESPIAPEGIRPPPPVNSPFPKKQQPSNARSSRVGTLVGFNALVFLTSVCVMTLELTASRLIAKHVGSSLYTWTSVIGVVLAGITLGNWLGGWMADKYNRSRSLAWMYLLGSISCGSVLWLDQLVGTISRPESLSWSQWIVTLVGAIFLLPALFLGATSPLVASMALERGSRTGSTVGNVYAWGALGSIFGTFLTGFYLIDVWGTRSIVGMTAGTLGILAVIVGGSHVVFRTAVMLGWIQLLGWTVLAAVSSADAFASAGVAAGNLISLASSEADATAARDNCAKFARSFGEKLHELGLLLRLRDDVLHEYRDESNYSDIMVSEANVDGRPVKSLRLDKLIHSYYDPNDPTSLHYAYERVYAAVTKKVAWPGSPEPLPLTVSEIDGVTVTSENLPSGVTWDVDSKTLRIEHPSNELFSRLLALAPEAAYWSALEHLQRETTKAAWGGFSAVNLPRLPEGVVIPEDLTKIVRHDESLEVLIAYQPIGNAIRNQLIANTQSATWYQKIDELRRSTLKTSACFYGGGGYIFPRWFLKEYPGSVRIDVAELDPAVYSVVKTELGLTEEQDQRIHTTIGDARNFVDDQLRENIQRKSRNEPPISYDFIYADAFNDFSIPWHLTTLEFLQKTRDLLSERGVFQANIIDIYPRTTYPGMTMGRADVEYLGRLPNGVLTEDPKRDRQVRAASAFAPLELVEQLTFQYRLRIPREITPREQRRLQQVTWPDAKPPSKLKLDSGFQREIDVSAEREAWSKAIDKLAVLAKKPLTMHGKIPEELHLTSDRLDSWVSAGPPFEFVEVFRMEGDQYILGLRGHISPEATKKLVELAPQNYEWTSSVKMASEKSNPHGEGRFLGRYVATAARIFPNIYLFSTSHQQPDESRDTFVMVCSRQPLDLKSLDETGDWQGGPFASLETTPGQTEPTMSGQMAVVIALAEGQILADDFAPVDNLLIPVFNSQE